MKLTKAERRVLEEMAQGCTLYRTDGNVCYIGDRRFSSNVWLSLWERDLVHFTGYATKVSSWDVHPRGVRYRVIRTRTTPVMEYELTAAGREALKASEQA